MDFLIRVVCDEFVHKAQELSAFASHEVSGFDETGRDVQGGEPVCAVAFVLVVEARSGSADR